VSDVYLLLITDLNKTCRYIDLIKFYILLLEYICKTRGYHPSLMQFHYFHFLFLELNLIFSI